MKLWAVIFLILSLALEAKALSCKELFSEKSDTRSSFSEEQLIASIQKENHKKTRKVYRPLFTTDLEYIKQMFINKEERRYPRHMRRVFTTKAFTKDREYEQQIEMRRKLYKLRPDEVFQVSGGQGSRVAARETLHLIALIFARDYPETFQLEGVLTSKQKKSNPFGLSGPFLRNKKTGEKTPLFSNKEHPLLTAGRIVTEDLILTRPSRVEIKQEEESKKPPLYEHYMASIFMATPMNWRPRDFLGFSVSEIHSEHNFKEASSHKSQMNLATVINHTLHILKRIDWILKEEKEGLEQGQLLVRNNWFLPMIPTLSQPYFIDFPKPYISSHNIGDKFYLRSEYENLIKLPSGWILFTLKPYMMRMSNVVQIEGMSEKLLEGLEHRAPALDLTPNRLKLLKQYLKDHM